MDDRRRWAHAPVIHAASHFYHEKRVAWVSMGAYHSTKNFKIFETGTNIVEISWEKFQKIRKLFNFRKVRSHSTENSGNSRMKVKWNGNFQENIFENLGIVHEVVLIRFRNLCKFPIFYSAPLSSFGRDHSEFHISRKGA